jgi:predicted DNA-binding protein (UPF0251 family)
MSDRHRRKRRKAKKRRRKSRPWHPEAVPQRRTSVRKIGEILRLIHEKGLSQHETARAVRVGQPTVHDYLTRFRASGLTWPLPEKITDTELAARLFPPPAAAGPPRPKPDFEHIGAELKRKHVTLDLLWREYREAHPDGYSYSRYCHLFEAWKQGQDIVMRQEHQAGRSHDFIDPLFIVDRRPTDVEYRSVLRCPRG